MGPQLIAKSIYLVHANLGAAFRATAVPLVMAEAVSVVVVLIWVASSEPGRFDGAMGFLPHVVSRLISGVGMVYAAVRWHRYVLREDDPIWIPALSTSGVAAYFGASIRFIGAILPLALLFAGVVGELTSLLTDAGSPRLAIVAGFGVWVVLSYVALRFSLIFPAAAVGERISLGASWRATSEWRSAILIAGLLVSLMLALHGAFVASMSGPVLVLIVISFPLSWYVSLLVISLPTTLYGVLIEGRSLD